jgi:hypothetical protein
LKAVFFSFHAWFWEWPAMICITNWTRMMQFIPTDMYQRGHIYPVQLVLSWIWRKVIVCSSKINHNDWSPRLISYASPRD